MTRMLALFGLIACTGLAYVASSRGVGISQPTRQALSVRSGSSGSSGHRRGSGFFYSSGRRSRSLGGGSWAGGK